MEEAERYQQYRKVIVIYRWFAFLTALLYLRSGEHIAVSDKPILFLLFLLGFLFLLFYQHLLPRIYPAVSFSNKYGLEIFADILIPALFVWFSGGHASPFFFLYYLFLARAAFTFERKWVLTEVSLISLVLFTFYVVESTIKPEIGNYFWHHIAHLSTIIGSMWVLTFLCLSLTERLHNILKKEQDLALQNQKLYQEKEKEVQRIASINQISKIINSDLDLERIYFALIEELKKIIQFDRLSVSILDETGKKVEAFAVTAEGKVVESRVTKSIEGNCVSWIVKHKKPLLRTDLKRQAHFSTDKLLTDEGINTCFSLPLFVKGKVRGTLCLFHKQKEAYSEKDLEILNPIADQLAVAIENAVLYEQIKKQAIRDSLTDLYNYGYFHKFLAEEFDRAKRYKKPFSIVMFDIDGFKEYNDIFGHLMGDEVLRRVATILKQNVREIDLPARYGGDEFVLVLPETGAEEAKVVVHRIEAQMEKEKFFGKNSKEIRLSLSSGIASLSSMVQDKEDLIRMADHFLYHSKRTIKKVNAIKTVG